MTNQSFGLEPQGPDIKRLMLAVVLMTSVLMLYNSFFAPTPATFDAKKVESVKEDASVSEGTVSKLEPAIKALKKVKGSTPDNLPEKEYIFEISVKDNLGDSAAVAVRGGYRAVLTNKGAQIKALHFDGYKEKIQLGGLTDQAGKFLTSLENSSTDVLLHASDLYEVTQKSSHEITFQRITADGTLIRRTYRFHDKDFIITHELYVENKSGNAKQVSFVLSQNASTKVDGGGGSILTPGVSGFSLVCRNAAERDSHTLSDLEDGAKTLEGQIKYGAVDERYFLIALSIDDQFETKSCTVSATEDKNNDSLKNVEVAIQQTPFILGSLDSKTYNFDSYIGPKQLNLLQAAGNLLDENINFGWFGVISRPLLWLLVLFFDFTSNFGIAIILLTIFIKLVTFPLTQKSFVSMQKMKGVAPELKKIQKKYGHDRTQLGQKQLEFYKEKGINPMAGCLPMLIQMPVWFALYQMLWNSVELFEQPFFGWIHDLTAPDPFFIMPVVMGISMFVQTFFQPTPEDQPQMKYVMWFMPIFLTFIMLSMPAGLSLYILTNNLLTIGQQMYIKKKYGDVK